MAPGAMHACTMAMSENVETLLSTPAVAPASTRTLTPGAGRAVGSGTVLTSASAFGPDATGTDGSSGFGCKSWIFGSTILAVGGKFSQI